MSEPSPKRENKQLENIFNTQRWTKYGNLFWMLVFFLFICNATSIDCFEPRNLNSKPKLEYQTFFLWHFSFLLLFFSFVRCLFNLILLPHITRFESMEFHHLFRFILEKHLLKIKKKCNQSLSFATTLIVFVMPTHKNEKPTIVKWRRNQRKTKPNPCYYEKYFFVCCNSGLWLFGVNVIFVKVFSQYANARNLYQNEGKVDM